MKPVGPTKKTHKSPITPENKQKPSNTTGPSSSDEDSNSEQTSDASSSIKSPFSTRPKLTPY